MGKSKVDEVSVDVDDAAVVAEELRADQDADPEKLHELQKTLEHASELLDEIDAQGDEEKK